MTAKTEIAVAKAAAQCVTVCAGAWTTAGALQQCNRIIGALVEEIETELAPKPATAKEGGTQ